MLLNRSAAVFLQQLSKYGQNVRTISTTEKCFRGKINIQRPRAPHYDRALFNAITEPVVPRLSVFEECRKKRLAASSRKQVEKQVHPYELIIAEEVRNRFKSSKMVAIFHVNSIKSVDMFDIRVAFHKENMALKAYGRSIMREAVKPFGYEAILPLFKSKSCIVFAEEAKIGTLLKIVRKAPQLILLAAIVENRLLSRNEFVELAKLPDLTTARAQLVGVINSAGAGLVGNLQAHQSNLCNLLDLHAKSNEKEEGETKGGENVETT